MNIKILKKTLIIILLSLSLISCRLPDNWGFYQPITLSVTVPEGPPEYKAGWYSGCKNAAGTKVFANAWVHQESEGAHFGSGVHQHDPMWQTGYSNGWYSCVTHINGFVKDNYRSFKRAPLSY